MNRTRSRGLGSRRSSVALAMAIIVSALLSGCGFITQPLEYGAVATAGLVARGSVAGAKHGSDAAVASARYLGRQTVAAGKAIDYRLGQLLAVPDTVTGDQQNPATAAASAAP